MNDLLIALIRHKAKRRGKKVEDAEWSKRRNHRYNNGWYHSTAHQQDVFDRYVTLFPGWKFNSGSYSDCPLDLAKAPGYSCLNRFRETAEYVCPAHDHNFCDHPATLSQSRYQRLFLYEPYCVDVEGVRTIQNALKGSGSELWMMDQLPSPHFPGFTTILLTGKKEILHEWWISISDLSFKDLWNWPIFNTMDPVGDFIKARCIREPTLQTNARLVWECWVDWCKEVGRSNTGNFYSFSIMDMDRKQIKCTRVGAGEYYLTGIKLKE